MTGCYAADRRRAIHRLGDHFDCCCHPEIMNAFIYALNDADEHVRAKAADEIGDQIRRNRCICGSPVIRALTTALGDCDPSVRRQAEQALKASGYRIEDGCCVTFSSGIRLSRSTTQNSETSGLTAADPVQKSETLAFVSPSAEQVGFSVDPDDDSDVAVIPPPVPARDPLSGAGLRLIDTFGYQKN
ncbi:MAG: HEAT repeat domain-containing protein [Planctomycetaceae bacterium]|nr:HEAT repeat domain-containing protein [Planctomycetaceae bacterium]